VHVQVGRSSHVRDELLANFRARGLEVLALIVLAAGAGGVLLTMAALAPLRALETTVGSILQTGRFDARVPIKGSSDPLDQLGGRVNQMLGRIQSLVLGMRGALDNVAHDLRTPLTRFRNVAEAALVTGDAARAHEGLAVALEEADRMNATLTALMDISEAENGTMALVREPIRLKVVVDEALSLYADEAEDRGVTLQSTVADEVLVFGDHTRLRQVAANLVENAVKYNRDGGSVRVALAGDEDRVVLSVTDTGIGIPSESIPRVFERFYRVDKGRARGEGGTGLGLALVKHAARLHGGRVDLASQLGVGSTFKVHLPLDVGLDVPLEGPETEIAS
jgi:signal transduction histidine kinase